MGCDINPYIERPDGSIKRKKSPKEMRDERAELHRQKALSDKAEQLQKSYVIRRDYIA